MLTDDATTALRSTDPRTPLAGSVLGHVCGTAGQNGPPNRKDGGLTAGVTLRAGFGLVRDGFISGGTAGLWSKPSADHLAPMRTSTTSTETERIIESRTSALSATTSIQHITTREREEIVESNSISQGQSANAEQIVCPNCGAPVTSTQTVNSKLLEALEEIAQDDHEAGYCAECRQHGAWCVHQAKQVAQAAIAEAKGE